MSIKRVTIPAHYNLEGILRTGSRGAGVVICHPNPLYGGSMFNNVVDAIEEGFSSKNFTALRFNFRGVGESAGVYGGGDGEIDDLTAALSFLKSHLSSDAHVTLAGYSFGAWICSRAAARLGNIDRLFLVAYPFAFYGTEELKAFSGKIYLVGGTRDELGPKEALLDFYQNLALIDKYLKIIPTDHFYWGKEEEIAQLIREQVGLEDQSGTGD
ncbi:MAG: hypothetical protein LBQ00_02950 [Syntrophobacterales bacterium]|jgi:alpha/beta superfamily hydrolase|nr:hypothetical protein [Syntrophobacterales bacterium]